MAKVVPIRKDIRVHAMTVKELRAALAGLDGSMEVVLRVRMHDGDDLAIGGLESVSVDAGCTDHDACVLDGDETTSSKHEDD